MTSARQVAVVGAGVTGLLAAVECVLAGHGVTVVDRGPIPNPGSSSSDQHRAVRTFAPGEEAATRRMIEARCRWAALETLLPDGFFRRVGVVTAWPADRIGAITGDAAAAGAPVTTLDPEKLPHLGFPAGSVGVLETGAGVVLAERVLRAAAGWLAAHPAAELRPGSAAVSVDVRSGRIGLADGGALGADLVLIAAGPWTPRLTGLPAVLHRQTMVYLRPPAHLARWWENAPAAGRLAADGRAWLLPPGEGTLLKISSDAVCREVATTDCAGEDPGPFAERLLAASIVSNVDEYSVVAVKQCHYLSGIDADGGLLARLGPAVWSRTPCNGTGFTTAPLAARQFAAIAGTQ